VADATLPIDTRFRLVLDEQFLDFEVKDTLPLIERCEALEEGKKSVLNEDPAELNEDPAELNEDLAELNSALALVNSSLESPTKHRKEEMGTMGRALIDEPSNDQALVESCAIDRETLRASALRLQKVGRPQHVSDFVGDAALIQAPFFLQRRSEGTGCEGLSAHSTTNEATQDFEVTGFCRSRSISRSTCRQGGPEAPSSAVIAVWGSVNREKFQACSRSEGPRDFEERRTGVPNNIGHTDFVKVMAAEVPRRSSLGRPCRAHRGGFGVDSSSDVEDTDVDVEVGKANCIVGEEIEEGLRGEEREGRGGTRRGLLLQIVSTSTSTSTSSSMSSSMSLKTSSTTSVLGNVLGNALINANVLAYVRVLAHVGVLAHFRVLVNVFVNVLTHVRVHVLIHFYLLTTLGHPPSLHPVRVPPLTAPQPSPSL
jgi:hypothetical protein